MQLRTPRGMWLKTATVLVGACTAGALVLPGVASATPTPPPNPVTIQVGANISGQDGNNPVIECSWTVGDHNPNGGAETSQYNYPTNSVLNPNGANKTLSTQTPMYSTGPFAPSFNNNSATGTNFSYAPDGTTNTVAPCQMSTSSNPQATMNAGTAAAPTSSGVAYTVNPFDSSTGNWVSDPGPAPKRAELWTAADYATSVVFDIFYPVAHATGVFNTTTEDTQLGAVQIGGLNACADWNTSGSLLNSMFGAAGPSGDNEISSTAWENTSSNGIIDHCNENQKSLWHQAFTISKDDPSGLYTVEVRANSSTGTATSWFSFVVNPTIALATDFSSAQFASNNGVYEISGDTVWTMPSSESGNIACDPGAPANSGVACDAPTIINGGNAGMQVGLAYTPLVYTPSTGGSPYLLDGKIFDANLGYNANYMMNSDILIDSGTTPNSFGPVAWIPVGANGAQLVCPNDDPKLDLSLSVPSGQTPGTYMGNMEIVGQMDQVVGTGGCLTDNNLPYVINGSYKTVTDHDGVALTRAS